MSDKVLLIDSDILTYRCGFSADAQAKKQWGKEKYLEHDYVEWALGNTRTTVEAVKDRFPEATHKLFLTGKTNFRDEVATIKKYKGNRDSAHKPKYYQEIRDYLQNAWGAEVVEGYEADDALAMAQFSNPDRSTCIVTIDKDLDMIPGWHFNWVKGLLYDVSIHEANRNFYRQMLIGDSTDNIPGVYGIGPKIADKLLRSEDTEETWQKIVREKYMEEYGQEFEGPMREVAILLWMRRKPDDLPPQF